MEIIYYRQHKSTWIKSEILKQLILHLFITKSYYWKDEFREKMRVFYKYKTKKLRLFSVFVYKCV